MNFMTYPLVPLQISDTGAGLWFVTLETTVHAVEWVAFLKLVSYFMVFVVITSVVVLGNLLLL